MGKGKLEPIERVGVIVLSVLAFCAATIATILVLGFIKFLSIY